MVVAVHSDAGGSWEETELRRCGGRFCSFEALAADVIIELLFFKIAASRSDRLCMLEPDLERAYNVMDG